MHGYISTTFSQAIIVYLHCRLSITGLVHHGLQHHEAGDASSSSTPDQVIGRLALILAAQVKSVTAGQMMAVGRILMPA